jgi:tripartite-type tricarboxylate transporter receptor subunit TctC
VLVLSLPSVMPQVKAGRLRALAVTSAKRSPFVPELPTVAEAGVPDYEARQWWGLFAPGATPRSVIVKINGEVRAILATDEIKTRLAAEGAQPILAMTPEEFNTMVKDLKLQIN